MAETTEPGAEGPGAAEAEGHHRVWTEYIEVAGSEVADRVKGLLREGNVRRLVFRGPADEVLIEVPLTAGVAVGAVATVFAPVLAAISALGMMLAKIKVEIVRTAGGEEEGR